MVDITSPRTPGVAAVLSLIIPGVGQIYNGDFLRGIFWLIITPGFWIGSGACSGGCATSSRRSPRIAGQSTRTAALPEAGRDRFA